MTTAKSAVENTVEDAVDADHRQWIEWLARLGYAAKGVVYFVIGILAVKVAMGNGGKTSGASGALSTIAGEPFGQILLVVTGVGLAGYALWRFVQAATDPEHKGTDAKGITLRLAYVCSGLIYAGLAFEAFRLVVGALGSGSGGQSSAQHWTARLMSQPYGPVLVGIVGAVILAAAGFQLYRAWSAGFMDSLKKYQMSAAERTWSERIGRAGFAARGIVYLVIGGCLMLAAFKANPNEAVGTGEALSILARQSYGPWLLGLVALGLAAYGVFSAGVLARYRRITVNT